MPSVHDKEFEDEQNGFSRCGDMDQSVVKTGYFIGFLCFSAKLYEPESWLKEQFYRELHEEQEREH